MTNEHVPLVPKKKVKKKKAKKKDIVTELFDEFDNTKAITPNSAEHTAAILADIDLEVEMVPSRCNFPPFFHYRLDANHNPILLGKSHWKGKSITDGEFCQTHGATTAELAKMFMKLCEKYATRWNWRGYTYNDEMRGHALLHLTDMGLKFNEQKSQNPFAYYTATITNSFIRILNIEKKMQNIRDDILESHGLVPSWTRQFQNDNDIERNYDDMPATDKKLHTDEKINE
jgi:hypothetical protein